jgi:hypothetical protein
MPVTAISRATRTSARRWRRYANEPLMLFASTMTSEMPAAAAGAMP